MRPPVHWLYRIFVCPFLGHDVFRFDPNHCLFCGKDLR